MRAMENKVVNGYQYMSSLLRSSFARRTSGDMEIQISGLEPHSEYRMTSYHHTSRTDHTGAQFTLKYEGIFFGILFHVKSAS